jgi:hypothetical protein
MQGGGSAAEVSIVEMLSAASKDRLEKVAARSSRGDEGRFRASRVDRIWAESL